MKKETIPTYDQTLVALRDGNNELLSDALFGFEIEDASFVEQVEKAIRSLLRRDGLTPEQIVGIGRALHGLKRLPLRTPGLDVQISLAIKDEGGAEEYELIFTDHQFITTSGGYIDSGHGSDSFSGTTFGVYPGSREYEGFSIFEEGWAEVFMEMISAELKVVDLSDESLMDWDHPDGSEFWEWIATQ